MSVELKRTATQKTYHSNPKYRPNAKKMKSELLKHEQQISELRSKYHKEYKDLQAAQDRSSVDKFMRARDKVLAYRKKKKDMVLNNVRNHEDYMYKLGQEYDRVRWEKNVDRLNKESMESAARIDALKRLKDESATFITPENIDEHIAKQLDPSRLVVPTIFYNRLGINDEPRYELHKQTIRALNYEREKNNSSPESVSNVIRMEYDDLFVDDDLYPHVRELYDEEGLVDRRIDDMAVYHRQELTYLENVAMARQQREDRKAYGAEEDAEFMADEDLEDLEDLDEDEEDEEDEEEEEDDELDADKTMGALDRMDDTEMMDTSSIDKWLNK